MNQIDDVIAKGLSQFWDMDVISLKCVDEEEGRRCYKALTETISLFVKAQRDQGEFVDNLERGIRVQAYLEENGFPTNRVFTSKNDNLVERFNGYAIVVEPWIEHRSFQKDLKNWHAFGELVGQLHSFAVTDALTTCISKMDPRQTLNGVLRQIDNCLGSVPEEYLSRAKSFREMANELQELESVPRTLIHSDLAWGNVIQNLYGDFILVDFEGGGIGPPVMDLVEVTTYLCQGPSASGNLQKDAAIQFYQGYAKHRKLYSSEVAVFPQAHLYHQLYYLANSLQRDDFSFIDRMSARLANWNGGVLDMLIDIALC